MDPTGLDCVDVVDSDGFTASTCTVNGGGDGDGPGTWPCQEYGYCGSGPGDGWSPRGRLGGGPGFPPPPPAPGAPPSKPKDPKNGPHYTTRAVCGASALLNKGGATLLDAVGIIPGGNELSAGVNTAISGTQAGTGLVSAYNAVSGGTLTDGASAGAGLGLTVAGFSLGNMTIQTLRTTVVPASQWIPIAGNMLSLASTINDVFGKNGLTDYYNDCLAGKN